VAALTQKRGRAVADRARRARDVTEFLTEILIACDRSNKGAIILLPNLPKDWANTTGRFNRMMA
jgi:hypothetical protein